MRLRHHAARAAPLSSPEPSAKWCCTVSRRGSSPADRRSNTNTRRRVRTRSSRRLGNSSRASPIRCPSLWVIVIGPTPSAAPPGAKGGDDNKPTAEAVVIKSVEFAKMAVVEGAGMKFMKPCLKRAGMSFVKPCLKRAALKFVEPGVKPAAMDKSGAKSAAMEAGNAGVKSSARETTMESAAMKPAMKPATMEPAANCEVRPQERRTEN